MKLLKNINIKQYTIKLIEDEQFFYGQIYRLDPVKLEILKFYIKIYLKTGFI